MKKSAQTVLRILILVIVLALIFFGLRYYFSNREVVTYTAPVTPVKVVSPEVGAIEQSIELSAYIESDAMVPIVPFVSGTILEYYIKDGDAVEKDQTVAKIDSKPYELQVKQAEAQAKAYESAYNRIKNLYDANAVTLQELEGVNAQRDAANAQLELANLQLSYAAVKAPVSGTVIMNKATVGSIATNTDYLAIVADMDNLVVNLNVSAAYYDVILDNLDNLEITVSDKNRDLESTASVMSVAPYIDPMSRNFRLKLKIESPDGFTIGSSVNVKIVYDRLENVLTLPASVLRLDNSLYYIEDGKAYLEYYTPEYSNDDVFLAPEKSEGRDFVIEGQDSLFSGLSVNIVED